MKEDKQMAMPSTGRLLFRAITSTRHIRCSCSFSFHRFWYHHSSMSKWTNNNFQTMKQSFEAIPPKSEWMTKCHFEKEEDTLTKKAETL